MDGTADRARRSTHDDRDVELRPKLVGQRIKRFEDPRLLAGTGRFVDDITPAGTLLIAFRRSDHPHARIKSIQVGERGFRMPGVVRHLRPRPISSMICIPPSRPRACKGYYATPIWPLARGKVRYVGEPVVAVLAENRYIAEDALEHVIIEYEALPFAIRAADAAAPGAPLLHEEAGTNAIIARSFGRGDVDAAFAQRRRACRRHVPAAPQDADGDGKPRLPGGVGQAAAAH